MYFCLRNGLREPALLAASTTSDNGMLKQLGDNGLKPFLEEWFRNNRRLSDRSALLLAREAERLLRDKASLKTQLRYPYLVLLCGLLSGDARVVEGLGAAMGALQASPVLTTLEDFMWAKLCMIAPPVGVVGCREWWESPSREAGYLRVPVDEFQLDFFTQQR